MADPMASQIKQAVMTILLGITGDCAANRVYRCHREWQDSMLDRSVSAPGAQATIYAVRSEGHRHREETTGHGMLSEVELFVLLARSDDRATDHPEAEEEADIVADRLEAAVVGALADDVTLGGLVNNVMGQDGIDVQTIPVAGWLVRELRTTVNYRWIA